jgi:H+/Cl- antiporter ClcA
MSFATLRFPRPVKVAIGGLLTGAIGFFFPDVLGASYSVIQASITAGSSEFFVDHGALAILGFLAFFFVLFGFLLVSFHRALPHSLSGLESETPSVLVRPFLSRVQEIGAPGECAAVSASVYASLTEIPVHLTAVACIIVQPVHLAP